MSTQRLVAQGFASGAQCMAEPVLITGAAGFIGTHLARALAGRGVPVRALVRADRDASVLEAMGVQVCRGDVTDVSGLRSCG